MAEGTNRPLRLQCAWCGRMIHAGESPTSHGICERCYQRAAETAPPPVRAAPNTPTRGEPRRHR
jgi:hypothetical protein